MMLTAYARKNVDFLHSPVDKVPIEAFAPGIGIADWKRPAAW